jgi:hypothetical protein
MLGRAQEGAEKRLARPLWVISEHVQRKQVRSAIVEAKETAGWRSLRNRVNRFAQAAAALVPAFRKARRSELIVSACVVIMPCGRPLYVFSVPFFKSFADSGPAAT